MNVLGEMETNTVVVQADKLGELIKPSQFKRSCLIISSLLTRIWNCGKY